MTSHDYPKPLDYAVAYLKKKFWDEKALHQGHLEKPDAVMIGIKKLQAGVRIVSINKDNLQMERTGQNSAPLVEAAEHDPMAFDAARELAAELIRRGCLLPDPLKEFASDVLENKIKRPTRKGKSPFEMSWRNYYFALLAFNLRENYGLNLYRNEVSRHKQSCFDIIVKAVEKCAKDTGDRELFPAVNYDAVRKAYEEIRQTFPD